MPTYIDAIGYLDGLAKEISKPWFNMVCDLVTMCQISTLDQPTLDSLFALYTDRASYIGTKPSSLIPSTPVIPAFADYLEHLSGFANFKRLGNELEVCFTKPITMIFGANGSGKSSLCEALKVLATQTQPNRPLENVRADGSTDPTFRFKFRNDPLHLTWTRAMGYGPRRATIKYFDNAIAIQNVTSAVEPGRIITLTPFKLHIFECTKSIVAEFRDALQKAQKDNLANLNDYLGAIRGEFFRFKDSPLATIDGKTVGVLLDQIKLGESFKDHELLNEKRTTINELEKATSEEGLKLLRAEYRDFEDFITSLKTLLASTAELWLLEPAKKANILIEKQSAQEALAKTLIPKHGTIDDLMALLKASSPICEMGDAVGLSCPLCKRDLGVPEIELFRQYNNLLVGELEKDIKTIKADIAVAREYTTAIEKMDLKSWEKYATIPEEILEAAKTNASVIIDSSNLSKEPTTEARAALEALKVLSISWTTQLESKKKAIDAAAKGRDELTKQLESLRVGTEPLDYAKTIADRLTVLKETQQMIEESRFWNTKLPAFTQVLKRITEKAKEAHEELVVLDFEARLDAEYKALAEKDMAALGVKLARRGADATVTVLPQIGGRGIDSVLSEGEQRIHALALFFAELETCHQSVLVFDDPISSFDYNYIANYCARLRDYTVNHPTRQIIVLTHNWEFCVQLQTTLNQAGLDQKLSVQVLENCTVVADYSEKIGDLKNDINAVLSAAGEPTKANKEHIAGKMRRLIEAIVNTHVFNHQRHQYKQKNQPVTQFQAFTKIVALRQDEATILRDLYAKLSITEHDDPRNAYVNTDKAVFQTRYNQIIAIENAIKSRIP